MISLGDDKIWCVAFFYETNWNCFSSIDKGKEKCIIQNAENEVLYASNEISFLIGLLTHSEKAICSDSKFI